MISAPSLLLVAAILLEGCGTVCMRLAVRNATWRLPAYGLYAASFSLFPDILVEIPLPAAYATWSAGGSAFITAVSVFAFGDSLGPFQLLGLAGCVASIPLLHVRQQTPPASVDPTSLLS